MTIKKIKEIHKLVSSSFSMYQNGKRGANICNDCTLFICNDCKLGMCKLAISIHIKSKLIMVVH